MSHTQPRLGDIGEGQREYEFEPLTLPASVPEPVIEPSTPTPVTTPEREPVPA